MTVALDILSAISRDRIVVSTSRCGRDNPGSNPGHGSDCRCLGTAEYFLMNSFLSFFFNFFIIVTYILILNSHKNLRFLRPY